MQTLYFCPVVSFFFLSIYGRPRAEHYIFIPWFLLLSSSSFFFFFFFLA